MRGRRRRLRPFGVEEVGRDDSRTRHGRPRLPKINRRFQLGPGSVVQTKELQHKKHVF